MKLPSIISIALLSTATCGVAATYSVNNGSGPEGFGIVDPAGNPYVNEGTVSIGVFAEGTDFSSFSTPSQVASSFTQFGQSASFRPSGFLGTQGLFNLSTNGNAADQPFVGNNIFLLVGDQASFESSTEFLVLSSSEAFEAADDDSGTPFDVIFDDSSGIVLGSSVENVPTSNGDTSTNQGFRAVVIPEPSSLLLGLVSAFGLLRRRRS